MTGPTGPFVVLAALLTVPVYSFVVRASVHGLRSRRW
jgi:hypothetical protein